MKSKFSILVTILAAATALTILYSPKKSKIEVSVPKPEVLFKSAESPYEYGFQKGYCALLMQYGENVARPKMAIYTSSEHESEHENESEEMARGYVDGYHRACESFSCPRKD